MNLTDLKYCMKLSIMDPLDHKNLDKDVPFFETRTSTAENLALFIWESMTKSLILYSVKNSNPSLRLIKVKVWETESNIAVYHGENSSK